jgi:hypothetical protein
MRRLVAAAAIMVAVSTPVQAQPTASLNPGYSFVNWFSVNNSILGLGDIEDNFVLYYLKEKQIGDLQSWLIFFDPNNSGFDPNNPGRNGDIFNVFGTVTFGAPIASLFTTSEDINITSAAYRLSSGVSYGGDELTGLESPTQQSEVDAASFSGNVLTFNFYAYKADYVRVLTTVPEPSTYALLTVGLSALALATRRRKRA